jgi:putative ABC transport system permease protein
VIRATLKSLLARKLRLTLSGLAVVLGVMSVSGAFVLSQTLTDQFDKLFQTVGTTLDVTVAGRAQVDSADGAEPVTKPVPDSVRQKLEALPGAADVTGQVFEEGLRVIGKDGKIVQSFGPPGLGLNWNAETDLNELVAGRAPQRPNEVVVNDTVADRGHFTVGDQIKVLTLEPARTFTIVGVEAPKPDIQRPTGDLRVAFTDPVAQELMLGGRGQWTRINLDADAGTTPAELKQQVVTAVGPGYEVQTGSEFANDQDQGLQDFIGVLRTVLLGFAAVALFVGIFLILNTFSILVAQRTSELALLRALGAGRGQVMRSVLAEAVLVGVIASTIGFGAGIGVAVGLRSLMESFGGVNLPPGISIPAVAVIASYAVGILVTVVAALLPALRAAGVAPVAAMRTAAGSDRPLTRLTVTGGAVAATGIGAVGAALFGDLGDALTPVLLGGVLLGFVGIAMLTPAISRLVVPLLGRAFSWSAPGSIGRRNSARNPRRTAVTAAALMVGVTLVTGVSVLANSLKASVQSLVTSDLRADLVIAGSGGGPNPTGSFPDRLVREVRQIPGVASMTALHTDTAQVGPTADEVAAGDAAGIARVFGLDAVSGDVRRLGSDQILLSDTYAEDHHLAVGDSIRVATQRGEPHQSTVTGIFERSGLLPNVVLPAADAENFRTPQATSGYITLDAGADAQAVRSRIGAMLNDAPDVTVTDRAGFAAERTDTVDVMLTVLNILIGLSILIAVLGVVNTLTLSLVERVRELGLVRAIGMNRRQVVQMVTVESVVITVFGALLGIAVGTGLGAAVVASLGNAELPLVTMAIPVGTIGVLLGLAVVVGLVAAVLPAARASRVDVLRAIAYE